MAKIKISYTAPGADVVAARINDSPVSFSGTAKAGQADVNLNSGNYRLRYTVEGMPGTPYTFKIEGSTPDKTVNDTIGPTGLAAGAIPFTVGGALAMVAAGAAVATAAAVAVARRGAKKKAAKRGAKKAAAKKRPPTKTGTAAKKRTTGKKRSASKKGGR